MLFPRVLYRNKRKIWVPGNKGSKHRREVKGNPRIIDISNLERIAQEDEEDHVRLPEKLECLIYLATLRVFITVSENLRMN